MTENFYCPQAGQEVYMKKHHSFVEKLSAFIVRQRRWFFLFYAAVFLFCLASMNWVTVEQDVTQYLPEDTETRQGIETMNDNFATFATARIMVPNITYDNAKALSDAFSRLDGVTMVLFDDSSEHYRDASALYDVNFSGPNNDPAVLAAMQHIREELDGYDAAIDTLVGYDEIAEMHHEMNAILLLAVVIILLVLTLTSRSYLEVPVLLLTFGMAAVMNMGTNFIFPKISFVSDAVAVVLQLALAIDYAIILCHRFSDEHETKDAQQACIAALSKSIPEISASSMTTISGLIALAFMKFAIGMDMAVVMIKSIFLSMLSVFTLMPGLLVLFSPLIDKTRHKKLLPNISLLGKFAVKVRRVLPVVFVCLLVGAFWLSSQSPYCYSYTNVETAKMTSAQKARKQIRDTFGESNMVAVLVPSGQYEAERAVLAELNSRPEVKGTMALSDMEAMDGYRLTDALTPRQFSELVGFDYEVAQALYTAYAVGENQYGELLAGLPDYDVPLLDMFLFLKEQMQSHNITLEGQPMIGELFAQMDTIEQQMQNDRYSRMVVYLDLPEESQETFDFLAAMREILGRYYEDGYYIVGNSTSSRDLAASFAEDNLIIGILSAVLVVVVLLFTFKSVGLPLLLIIVIQGSIWINFSFPTLTHTPLYFLGYLIVSAIQMGANIDYAIVISSHYQDLKARMPHKQAIVQALNESFPTVFTSGTIMSAAGLLIGNMSAQPVVAIMGTCLGRGTIISVILVLFVLPSVLVLGDSIIEHTRFRLHNNEAPTAATGTIRVRGHVRGYVSGMIDAHIDGTLHGDLNASIQSEQPVSKEGEDSHA